MNILRVAEFAWHVKLPVEHQVAYHDWLPAEVVHEQFKLETGIIGPSQVVGNMFSQTFHNNKDEAQDRSLLRLPLNLVALIIRHVCR